MASTIDRPSRRITIPQADLTLVAGVYQFDVNAWYEEMRASQALESGRGFPKIATRNPSYTASGVTYAPGVLVINGYTIEFEDTGTAYIVDCQNANHNLLDVHVVGTSEVSLQGNNSAGLIEGGAGASVDDMWNADPKAYDADTMGGQIQRIRRKV